MSQFLLSSSFVIAVTDESRYSTYFQWPGYARTVRKRPTLTTNISWRDLYAAAMLELDRTQLPSRIEAAEAAIKRAMDELMIDGKLGAVEETQGMADALRALQTLHRVELTKHSPACSNSRERHQAER